MSSFSELCEMNLEVKMKLMESLRNFSMKEIMVGARDYLKMIVTNKKELMSFGDQEPNPYSLKTLKIFKKHVKTIHEGLDYEKNK
jgi:hypothetical protein